MVTIPRPSYLCHADRLNTKSRARHHHAVRCDNTVTISENILNTLNDEKMLIMADDGIDCHSIDILYG